MPDNVNITVNETIENVVINPSISTDVIDVNITSTTENVNIAVTPELTTININSVTSVSPVTSVNGQIGDVVIPTSDNNFTTVLKNKLDGIQAGAEVNVNADWNATSGDAQILNKPTIPSIAGLATTTYVDTQDALKVDKNTAITGATKTKITFDSKGLVTSGADATTADIADSSNKRYQTDNQQSFNDATSSIQTQLNSKGTFTLPSFTSGSVLFSNGTTIAEDNGNLFWDDTNNKLGIGTATPAASSKLDITSTTQGFLPPRMTTTQRNAIASPATGLVVYDTTLLSEFQYNGTSWISNQPQLNGTGFVKASGTTISYDNSVYNPIVINDFAGGTVTGTVANTIVASYLIAANTFKNKDAFSLTSYIYLSGAKSANQTLRFYFNSTVSLTGATLIGTFTYTTAIRFGIFERMGTCTSEGNLLIWPPTFSTLSDRTTTASDYSLPAFPYTSNNYLIVAIQIGNISDFASLGLVRLTK